MQYSTDQLEALVSLQRHPGWQLLQAWISEKIQLSTQALVRDDLTVPTRAARLQGKIDAFNELNRHLEFVAEQYQKRLKE